MYTGFDGPGPDRRFSAYNYKKRKIFVTLKTLKHAIIGKSDMMKMKSL